MNNAVRRMFVGASIFAATCIIAVIGYMIAGWQLLDAIYMVVITVFGVGYGEAKPLSHPGLKLFTMGVIIAGCSSAIYVVGGFVTMLAEGEINRVLGNRRMSKGIVELKDHAILCGFGRIGQVLAEELAAAKHPFVVIDSETARVEKAQEAGYLALLGSASEESTLETAGIARARVLATVLPSDTANVFVALTARELNSTIQIIARAETASTEKKLMRSGANRVVMPAVIGATRIAHIIARPTAEDLLLEVSGVKALKDELAEIGLDLTEVAVVPGSALIGQSVGDMEGGAGGFVIVAVKRADGSLARATDPTIKIGVGDSIVLLGHHEAVPQLTRRARTASGMTYRGASV
ncbi:MAG TPA: potassium channel protein [Pirellulales bacterium]|jgi:voltage-gated potassium channel